MKQNYERKMQMFIKTNNQKMRNAILSILVIGIFSLSIILMNNQENTIVTNSKVMSNKKIEWGIKRNDNNEQPDVGQNNRKILEENNGICLGNKDKKYVYLTFDEGYEAGYTPKILETLKSNDVKATFFITAHYLNTQEDLVKQMIDEAGNDIKIKC